MKTDYVLTKRVPLGISVLICTTLLLFGCQDGSNPVAQDGDDLGAAETISVGKRCEIPPCGGGGPGGDPQVAKLILAEGMLQATGFFVEVKKDTGRTLKVSNHNLTETMIEMRFNPHPKVCEGIAGRKGGPAPAPNDAFFGVLVAKLNNTEVRNAKVVMYIDKTNIGQSGDHSLIVQYVDDDLGNMHVLLGGWPGPVFVEVVEETIQNDKITVYAFEGSVVIWPGSDTGGLRCLGQTVVVTLDRSDQG